MRGGSESAYGAQPIRCLPGSAGNSGVAGAVVVEQGRLRPIGRVAVWLRWRHVARPTWLRCDGYSGFNGMQDRYAGDIGDYVKLALLRKLQRTGACRALGVAWYRVPDQQGNADGRHTNYLSDEHDWGAFCPETFLALRKVIQTERSVGQLQATGLLGSARFHDRFLDARQYVRGSRAIRREADWFAGLVSAMASCDLVFVDPDNGIAASGFDPEGPASHKSITLGELKVLGAARRPLVVYHHQTRFKGGHLAEIDALHARLRAEGLEPAGSLRARPWSPRLFIFVNASDPQVQVARQFAEHWQGHVDWFPARESAMKKGFSDPRGRRRN